MNECIGLYACTTLISACVRMSLENEICWHTTSAIAAYHVHDVCPRHIDPVLLLVTCVHGMMGENRKRPSANFP